MNFDDDDNAVLENTIKSNRIRNTASARDDVVDQWTTIREELIFRKFHKEIAEQERQSKIIDDNTRQQNDNDNDNDNIVVQ
mmetsp:Transcript_9979/g.21463  ORF Transcript_9979/g.21463 Transcript_9979/m.21463 type:complete len:81 (+) Transcript_9979:2-244(+)